MIPTYQFGTFDVANYGDLLFPLLAQRRMASLDTKLIAVSPIGGAPVWKDCMLSIPVGQIKNIKPPACVLIGGGYIIRLLPMRLPVYNQGTVPLFGNPDLWIGASKLAMNEVPICWNAPGVPFPFSKQERPFVCECIERSDYVSVRDEPSRRFILEACPGAKITIVPDPAWDISNLWTQHELLQACEKAFLSRGKKKPDRIVAAHVNTAFIKTGMEETVAGLLDQISRQLDTKVVLTAIGPCHGDDKLARDVGQRMKTSPLIVDQPDGLREIAGIIAHAQLYVGSSMHGLITASSFCVPAVCITSNDIPKFLGLQQQIDLENTWALSWEDVPNHVSAIDMNHRTDQLRQLRGRMQEKLDCHWDHISAIFRRYSQTVSKLADKDANVNCNVTSKLSEYHTNLATVEVDIYMRLNDQAKIAITQKNQSIAQLHSQISDKAKTVTEKEQMITRLRDEVVQKEVVITEKEQALCNANVTITEKEQMISRLRDEVTQKKKLIVEKEQALCNANVTITEKEQMITRLRDEVVQKEAVIAEKEQLFREKTKTLTETRNSIAQKDREIHRYREELFSVYTSRSWRCMLPCRKVGNLIRYTAILAHKSQFRAIIKRVYFAFPAFIRNTIFVEKFKNHFKSKEWMR